jgi:hypothetical protein
MTAGDQRRWRERILTSEQIAAALFSLVITTPIGALSADLPTAASPPARIGNHYNHRAYQPRTREVCAAERSSGIDCDSPAGKRVQGELERIEREFGSPPNLRTPSSNAGN